MPSVGQSEISLSEKLFNFKGLRRFRKAMRQKPNTNFLFSVVQPSENG